MENLTACFTVFPTVLELLIQPDHVAQRDAVFFQPIGVAALRRKDVALDPPEPEPGLLVERELPDTAGARAEHHPPHAPRLQLRQHGGEHPLPDAAAVQRRIDRHCLQLDASVRVRDCERHPEHGSVRCPEREQVPGLVIGANLRFRVVGEQQQWHEPFALGPGRNDLDVLVRWIGHVLCTRFRRANVTAVALLCRLSGAGMLAPFF
jgi:hypothetical protein